jgi:hypothetical protein
MTTRKSIGLGALVLAASLGGGSIAIAEAAEEFVVSANAPVKRAAFEPRTFEADVEQYIRAFNEQLRTTISEDLKRQRPPKIEVASRTTPTRG